MHRADRRAVEIVERLLRDFDPGVLGAPDLLELRAQQVAQFGAGLLGEGDGRDLTQPGFLAAVSGPANSVTRTATLSWMRLPISSGGMTTMSSGASS